MGPILGVVTVEGVHPEVVTSITSILLILGPPIEFDD